MGENRHQLQGFDVSLNVPGSKCLDDDGRLKRTGTVWTTSAHIITAVIGSGVLSLAWATAQLGWIAGPNSGKRNYTYMDAVRANLGGFQVKICGAIQYTILLGTAIGYTIVSSKSMEAIERSNCFHSKGHKTAMSFTYSSIGLGLGIAKVAENGKIRGSLTGVHLTPMKKIWSSFEAFGNIAFAYSFSLVLIEIQDTIKSPPSEYKTMKKATLFSGTKGLTVLVGYGDVLELDCIFLITS
ncbi:unnamed protein product [Fraxinus pennsylvanica]|uniref:Amino acid transporter transmembrane domain-containing protein n=1 Tax=Fraxinus pennsylvanica TaxID=56036 RepID=A0AAD2ECQ4_9LAMI|nr:unnamed protein product [Fraxinus pennsylvanica]